MEKCILISGNAEVGKDEVAKYIEENYDVVRFSLADPVKESVKIIFNLEDNSFFHNRRIKEKMISSIGFTPRQLCQLIGQGMRDLVSKDVWCKNLYVRAKRFHNKTIVVSDNRYDDEIEFFSKHYDVITIRLFRKNKTGNVGFSNHISEQLPFKAKYDIDNNDTFDKLFSNVDKILLKEKVEKLK